MDNTLVSNTCDHSCVIFFLSFYIEMHTSGKGLYRGLRLPAKSISETVHKSFIKMFYQLTVGIRKNKYLALNLNFFTSITCKLNDKTVLRFCLLLHLYNILIYILKYNILQKHEKMNAVHVSLEKTAHRFDYFDLSS